MPRQAGQPEPPRPQAAQAQAGLNSTEHLPGCWPARPARLHLFSIFIFENRENMEDIRRRKREAIQRARKGSLEKKDEDEFTASSSSVPRHSTNTPVSVRLSSTPRSRRSVGSNKSLGDADPLGDLFTSENMEASLSVRIEPHVKRLRTQARELVNGQEQSVKVREERLNQAVEELEKAR